MAQRYGATVKRFDLVNQTLKELKNEPFSRRHIINLYQYADLKETKGLSPCAFETIWSVRKKENNFILDLTLIQRSNDYIMAGYINKIQYVALQMMFASHLGYEIGNFCHLTQNLHDYDRHLDALNEIKNRQPIDIQPSLILKNKKNFKDFVLEDFEIIGTENIKKIKFEKKTSDSALLNAQLRMIARERNLDEDKFYHETMVLLRHHTLAVLDFLEGLSNE